MATIPVALTMYSVREEAARDYFGTVREVAAMGYRGIQTHYNAVDPGQLKDLADDLGITVVGVHTPLQAMVDDLEAAAAFNLALDCPDIVCPSLPEDYRSKEGYPKAGEMLTGIGQKLAEKGLRLSYHNHAFEWDTFDGAFGFDLMFGNANSKYLKAELDVYWLKYANQDPVVCIRRFSGNLPLLHIKDMEPGSDRFFAEIGEGILDWRSIFKASEEAGVLWAIVEQDAWRRPPLESARLSLDNLVRMGLAKKKRRPPG